MEEGETATPRKKRSGTQQRKKLHMVTTGYDADEFAQLEAAASKAGLTKASYQRVQTIAKPKTRSVKTAPIEKELLAKVLGQLGKIGSNLNQIAHAAHLGHSETFEVSESVKELRALLPVILSALGAPRK